MEMTERFNRFAADFETAVQHDNWSVLEKHLTEDATYLNVGSPDPQWEGRRAITEYLQNDVAEYDRRFDSRTLVALTEPEINKNQLRRKWQCTYTLHGAPDLVVEGEARYTFEDDLIKSIEEEPTPLSMQQVATWMENHAHLLNS